MDGGLRGMTKRDDSIWMVARLVSLLAENGVHQTDVTVTDLIPEGADQESNKAFFHIVEWLEAEGVVRPAETVLRQRSAVNRCRVRTDRKVFGVPGESVVCYRCLCLQAGKGQQPTA